MSENSKRPIAVLAVGGGVAAYKSVFLASRLHQAGYAVHVQLTAGGAEFVQPLCFSAVTTIPARTEVFHQDAQPDREEIYPHLYPASEAELFVVAPATADLIAKLALGIADNLVTSSALATPAGCRRYFCPAMNAGMWAQPVVQENVARLEARGWQRLGPVSGHQACGAVGAGRMLEAEEILGLVLNRGGRLGGQRVLILSGPTVEHFDPVRFLSNHSSGKMGAALALACAWEGAQVEFVTGPVPEANLPRHPAVTIVPVTSAMDMLAAGQARFAACQAAIFAAAVADYTPVTPLDRKAPKGEAPLHLELRPTPDIAATLGTRKQPGQFCLGFALETDDGPAKAKAKMARKNLDAIVLNTPASMGAEDGEFTVLTAAQTQAWGQLSKRECAARLVNLLATHTGNAAPARS